MRRKGKLDEANSLSLKIGKKISDVVATHLSNVSCKDTKTLWASVHSASGRSKYRQSIAERLGPPFNDVNAINNHFTTIATDPDYDIERVNEMIQTVPNNDLPLYNIYEYEVFLLFTSIKKTSPGPDKLPYWFFRYAAAELTPVVTHLIRLTLSNGTPPEAWKRAVITPVPKVTSPQNLSDLRPISVTPILSRLVEKLIARKYLTPALPTKLLEDQYAYRPTGSTTAALVDISHHITLMLETNTYVRCILIDYSKAFDTINHEILFAKLRTLSIPQLIKQWIMNFLTGRTQAVVTEGTTSNWLPISRSIVQGSGLGPMLFVVYALDLKPISEHNRIIKYADDTTLLVAEKSSVDVATEFGHLEDWSRRNKLTINKDKTVEIIFRRPKSRHFLTPAPLPCINQVDEVKLLGVYLTNTFSSTAHVNHLLTIGNQRLFLLSQLKNQGLALDSLHIVYQAIIQSKIIYALPAFAGQLTAMDITRVDALARKAKRRGLAKTIPSMLEIIEDHDESLFKRMRDPSHCLHHLLPPVRPNTLGRLRSRGHPYTLPQINFKQHKLSFPTRCLFNNM